MSFFISHFLLPLQRSDGKPSLPLLANDGKCEMKNDKWKMVSLPTFP
jgi:hypothetical protein